MNTEIHNTNTEKGKNHMLRDKTEMLDYLPRYMGIQYYLLKAARRLRRQGRLHR